MRPQKRLGDLNKVYFAYCQKPKALVFVPFERIELDFFHSAHTVLRLQALADHKARRAPEFTVYTIVNI